MRSTADAAPPEWAGDDEMSCFRCREGERDGLRIAHLADDEDVGIFAQCIAEAVGEVTNVHDRLDAVGRSTTVRH